MMSFIMAELSKGFRELPVTIRSGVEPEQTRAKKGPDRV